MPNKLDEARKIINEVDAQMAELFVKRMRAAELVYEYKKEFGLPILDEKREAAVMERNTALVEDEVLKSYYMDFLSHVMSLSRDYQHRLQSGLKVEETSEPHAERYVNDKQKQEKGATVWFPFSWVYASTRCVVDRDLPLSLISPVKAST